MYVGAYVCAYARTQLIEVASITHGFGPGEIPALLWVIRTYRTSLQLPVPDGKCMRMCGGGEDVEIETISMQVWLIGGLMITRYVDHCRVKRVEMHKKS